MEDLLSTNIDGQPTNYGAVFHEVTQRLETAGIRYSFAGTLALGMYLRPRFTDEIEVLCNAEEFRRARDLLVPLDEADHAKKVSIRLNAGSRIDHLHALANCRRLPLFGTLGKFASPLSLAWILLDGKAPYADHDVAQLLIHRLVAVDEIVRLLEQHHATQATDRLARIRDDVDKGRYSRSYSDSVKARLCRRGCY